MSIILAAIFVGSDPDDIRALARDLKRQIFTLVRCDSGLECNDSED